jgi:hypothetical protein
MLLGLCGCSQQKQAAKKTSWLLAHDLMDDECARLFPTKDSIIKGDTITNLDTLYLENDVYIRDTVVNETGETIFIEKRCPPHQTITKRIFVVDTVFKTNTAEVEKWRSIVSGKDRQIKEKDDIVINQQKKIDNNDWWKVACLITWFSIVLGVVFRIFIYKKPI